MKRCEACGKTFADTEKFCDVCGKELVEVVEAEEVKTEEVKTEEVKTEEVKTEEVKTEEAANTGAAPAAKTSFADKFKAMDKKTKIICGAAAAAVLLAIVVIICVCTGSKSYKIVNKDAINLIFDSEAEKTYVYNGKGKLVKIGSDEERFSEVDSNIDHTVIVAYEQSEKKYYVITIKGATEIGEDLYNVQMSNEGNTICYIKDLEKEVGDLYLYTVKSKKDKKIASDVAKNSVVLSPDGKSVAFVKQGDEETKAYYSKNGKEATLIAKDSTPLAIANSASYIYYVKKSDEAKYLYVMKGKNNQKICEITSSLFSSFEIRLNKDLSECIFSDSDNKSWVYTNGKSKSKISNNALYSIECTPDVDLVTSSAGGVSVGYYTVKSFKSCVFYLGGAYYSLNSKYEAVKIISADSCDFISFSDDLKSVIYLKKDNLYKMSNVKKPDKTKKLGDMEDYTIKNMVVMSDMNSIYFISEGNLYYKKGTGKAKEIAEDVTLAGYDSDNDILYYYVNKDAKEANTLYYTKGGSKKKVASNSVKGVGYAYGSYYIIRVENAKDDAKTDLYVLNGKSKKKILTY